MIKPLAAIFGFLVFLADGIPTSASGAVIYTTLDPSDGAANARPIAGSAPEAFFGYHARAIAFSPTVDAILSSFELGLIAGGFPGTTTSAKISLEANTYGRPTPLATLASSTVAGPSSPFSRTIITVSYAGPAISLLHNLSYWIVIEPDQPTTMIAWTADTNAPAGTAAFSSDGVNYTTTSDPVRDVRVNGTPVPEPNAWVLLVGGALGIGMRRIRSRLFPSFPRVWECKL